MKKKKKILMIKLRQKWKIKPSTKIKESSKIYVRSKSKKEIQKQLLREL